MKIMFQSLDAIKKILTFYKALRGPVEIRILLLSQSTRSRKCLYRKLWNWKAGLLKIFLLRVEPFPRPWTLSWEVWASPGRRWGPYWDTQQLCMLTREISTGTHQKEHCGCSASCVGVLSSLHRRKMFNSLRFQGQGTSLKSGRDHFNLWTSPENVTGWISNFFLTDKPKHRENAKKGHDLHRVILLL